MDLVELTQKIRSEDELKEYFSISNETVIVEELIDGPMHDVNGVFDKNGVFHPMGIVDRFFLRELLQWKGRLLLHLH